MGGKQGEGGEGRRQRRRRLGKGRGGEDGGAEEGSRGGEGRGGRTRGRLGLMILQWAAGPAAVGVEKKRAVHWAGGAASQPAWGELGWPRPRVRPGPGRRVDWDQLARSQRGFSPAWKENLRPSYKVQRSSTATE